MHLQVSALQTVELVRQPKDPPSLLKTEEGIKNYYVVKYLKEIGILNKEDLDSDYSSLTLINFQNITSNSNEDNSSSYDEENNRWIGINDLPISESFLDNRSEFDKFNLATAKMLEWKVNKPSKFAVKVSQDNAIVKYNRNSKKGISNPTKNQFCIEDHRKIYTIPTFGKTLEINDLLKKELLDSLDDLNVTGLLGRTGFGIFLGRTGLEMLPDSLGKLDLKCYWTPWTNWLSDSLGKLNLECYQTLWANWTWNVTELLRQNRLGMLQTFSDKLNSEMEFTSKKCNLLL
ncbi:hypothetical protein C1645_817934 [Glomus cerebriforme]|uniref:Uncharacterized protein n=1 Tax=Glomus cerebriforme TaxID=658196 RepID=A0A397T870_9GLOM|nr:hypothetical protein C1645_817934 [Glomus cerebriforme]